LPLATASSNGVCARSRVAHRSTSAPLAISSSAVRWVRQRIACAARRAALRDSVKRNCSYDYVLVDIRTVLKQHCYSLSTASVCAPRERRPPPVAGGLVHVGAQVNQAFAERGGVPMGRPVQCRGAVELPALSGVRCGQGKERLEQLPRIELSTFPNQAYQCVAVLHRLVPPSRAESSTDCHPAARPLPPRPTRRT
jgi:hypothetical protein